MTETHALCGPVVGFMNTDDSAWHPAHPNVFHSSVTSNSLHPLLTSSFLTRHITTRPLCAGFSSSDASALSVSRLSSAAPHADGRLRVFVYAAGWGDSVGKAALHGWDWWGGDKSARWPWLSMHQNPFLVWELPPFCNFSIIWAAVRSRWELLSLLQKLGQQFRVEEQIS